MPNNFSVAIERRHRLMGIPGVGVLFLSLVVLALGMVEYWNSIAHGLGIVVVTGLVGGCSTRGEKSDPDRTFTIHAVEKDTVYSNYGLHNPRNTMYVLEEHLDDVNEAEGQPLDSDVDTSVLEPLTIRANEGEIIEVEFHNKLDRAENHHASMHLIGLPYDVMTSDGMNVGQNPDTTVAPGESTTYRWYASEQGTWFIIDGVNQSGHSGREFGNVNLPARGLFGALVVEPPNATWTDPETGGSLRSGTSAIIQDPSRPDHREFVLFYHNVEGAQPPAPVAGRGVKQAAVQEPEEQQKVAGMNYRAVRTSERNELAKDKVPSKGFYSSFPHGDPGNGDIVFEAYQGDPIKMVAINASIEENHTHHLHGHRWRKNPPSEWTEPFDSETIGMGGNREMYLVAAYGDRSTRKEMCCWEEAFAVGAGGPHGSVGDFLFHCHLFPHYGEGMNGHFRVHDETQSDLVALDNNSPPFDGDIAEGEGFPRFVPTVDDEEADEHGLPAFPPDRRPDETLPQTAVSLTPREEELPRLPGAPYADPVVEDDIEGYVEKREYHVVALRTEITYNDAGDHDPEGIAFVLEEDVEAVESGYDPEPLFIRANVGDLVELTFENRTDIPLSVHPHFVSFDILGSDSAMVGYNYDSGVDPGRKGTYRWYADEEGPVFVHDHMSGIEEGMHGPFAVLLVEPRGATWLDPYTGEEIRKGAKAMIVDADDSDVDDFREFALLYHDFAQLVEAGREQPDTPTGEGWVTRRKQHLTNQGVMGINYRNAPQYRRLKRHDVGDVDPAYVYSSSVLGDPPTPVLETYPDDPVRLRLVMGPYEEFHNFNLHGHHPTPDNRVEEPTSQIIGVSEKFSFELPQADHSPEDPLDNPDGLPIRDYLYGSSITDDLGNGMWGIYRVFGAEVGHLEPLPEQGAPSGSISTAKLREIGHPAPFDDRTTDGQQAAVDNSEARLNENIGQQPGEQLNSDAIPERAPGPGDVSPDHNGCVRRYEVAAVQVDLQFNEYGDHNPRGIAFVPLADTDAASGKNPKSSDSDSTTPEPLTIRANEGDVVEIELHNHLFNEIEYNKRGPTVRAEDQQAPFPQSNRISLHPQGTIYDVQGSDGTTVGFNYDQTVGPGESITYRWKVSTNTDSCVIQDMADVVGHWPNGAFGDLLVEPAGSEWTDPESGERLDGGYGSTAIISPPDNERFREFSVTFADSQYIINDDGKCVVPSDEDEDGDTPCNRQGDPEEQGFGTINYRSEPFSHRFETNDDQRLVYDSGTHGDPDTPVFRALEGDTVVFRVSQPAANSRGVSFHLAGHRWKRYPDVENSPLIGIDDDLIPGYSSRVMPEDGAGGKFSRSGDYVFQELKQAGRLEDGMWGIFRVRSASDEFDASIDPLTNQPE